MAEQSTEITPSTTVAALLDLHPELEEVLAGMAPSFSKLTNPAVRESVAKVASLGHAAAVAGLSVEQVVNGLRAAVGQEPLEADKLDDTASYFGEKPSWFHTERIVASIDVRTSDAPTMPLGPLVEKASSLPPFEILELVTTFLPAPGIDIMKGKGYRVWSRRDEPELIRTYFSKPPPRDIPVRRRRRH